MLAAQTLKPIEPYIVSTAPKAAPDKPYSGFPWWVGLVVEPAMEVQSAELLKRVNVHAYLPQFFKSYCRRGGKRYRRACAVLPGILLCPIEMLQIENRDEILDWGRVVGFVRGAGRMAVFSKTDVECIRRIEARLNMPDNPVDARAKEIKIGARVRFIDPQEAALFGELTVFEVASDNRIGVEGEGLFGKTYTTSAEIEVM